MSKTTTALTVADRNGEITREAVVEIARRLAAKWRAPFTDSHFASFEPTVVEGSHEEVACPWIVSWEDCPAESWAWSEALREITEDVTGRRFYAEAINSWSVAFWEA